MHRFRIAATTIALLLPAFALADSVTVNNLAYPDVKISNVQIFTRTPETNIRTPSTMPATPAIRDR